MTALYLEVLSSRISLGLSLIGLTDAAFPSAIPQLWAHIVRADKRQSTHHRYSPDRLRPCSMQPWSRRARQTYSRWHHRRRRDAVGISLPSDPRNRKTAYSRSRPQSVILISRRSPVWLPSGWRGLDHGLRQDVRFVNPIVHADLT